PRNMLRVMTVTSLSPPEECDWRAWLTGMANAATRKAAATAPISALCFDLRDMSCSFRGGSIACPTLGRGCRGRLGAIPRGDRGNPSPRSGRGLSRSRVRGRPVEVRRPVCDDPDVRWVFVIAGGVLLGIAAYKVQVDEIFSPTERAAAQVAIGWTFIGVGVVLCIRRAGNLLGPLLLAAGAMWLARQLRYADSALLFTTFFLLGDLCYAL